MGDAVLPTSRGGRVTYMSLAAEVLTGRTQKEVLGAGLRAILCITNAASLRCGHAGDQTPSEAAD